MNKQNIEKITRFNAAGEACFIQKGRAGVVNKSGSVVKSPTYRLCFIDEQENIVLK